MPIRKAVEALCGKRLRFAGGLQRFETIPQAATCNVHTPLKQFQAMSRGLSDEAANRQISQMTQFIVLEARQKADEIRIKVRQFS